MDKISIKHRVVVTSEASAILSTTPLIGDFLLVNKDHFNCSEVNPDGPYLHMKVVAWLKDKPVALEVSIRHEFVLYIFSGEEKQIRGFDDTAPKEEAASQSPES